MRATATRDYEGWEMGMAFLIAAVAQIAALLLLNAKVKKVISDVPEIDKGIEMPVKVKPVLDLDGVALKLGGKKPVLPDMWQAPAPPSPAAKTVDKSFASTKADEKDEPDKKKPMADAGTEPPPPDAGDKNEADAGEPNDAGTTEPTDNPEGSKQEGVDAGVADGKSTDASIKNQAATYRSRVASFFSRFIAGKCAGAEGAVASGTATLSAQTVVSVTVGPSGNATFDANVAPLMQGAVGGSVPPPPDEHQEFLTPTVSFTLVCPKAKAP